MCLVSVSKRWCCFHSICLHNTHILFIHMYLSLLKPVTLLWAKARFFMYSLQATSDHACSSGLILLSLLVHDYPNHGHPSPTSFLWTPACADCFLRMNCAHTLLIDQINPKAAQCDRNLTTWILGVHPYVISELFQPTHWSYGLAIFYADTLGPWAITWGKDLGFHQAIHEEIFLEQFSVGEFLTYPRSGNSRNRLQILSTLDLASLC